MTRRPAEPEPWDVPWRPAPRTSFERSARFWLNAYPLRWRDLHGDEVVGVLQDVAADTRPGGGAASDRLPRAEALGLVRAGWALRWREHPPFWRWLGYRFLDLRLPARYWWWVADDIRSPWYPAVRDLGSVAPWPFVVYAVYLVRTSQDPFGWFVNPIFWMIWAAIHVGISYATRNSRRRQAWLRHVVEGNVPQSARPARGAAGTMALGVDPAITGEPPEERPRT